MSSDSSITMPLKGIINSMLPPQGGSINVYNNTCPSCGGNKLSVSRLEDGTVLYNCFRQSCGLSGAIHPSGVSYPSVTQVTPTRSYNPYTEELVTLPSEEMDILHYSIGFEPTHFAISRAMWANLPQRVAYPIFGPRGNRQGWCLRSYLAGVTPKSLTYLDEGASKLSHYRRHDNRTAWLVEDIPSAVRASLFVNTVALLGTSIVDADLPELREHYDNVVICLDNDAIRQAIRLRTKIELMFRSVEIVVPLCDLKDMTEPQLEDFLLWPNED